MLAFLKFYVILYNNFILKQRARELVLRDTPVATLSQEARETVRPPTSVLYIV